MSETHEHLEHAEHAQHAAHDPFDRRVALTIAIIAAVLAAVTLLSHRAHNGTLQLQIQAGILQTQASDKWSEFQANNIRRHEYAAYARLIDVVALAPNKESQATQVRDDWRQKAADYEGGKLDRLMTEAKALEDQAKEQRHESHFAHEKSGRFDLGELAVEFGLVLCSVALLTKRAAFWYAGMIATAAGALMAATVLFMSPTAEAHGHEPAPAGHTASEKSPGH
jgi:hypothetical protein